jgi:hypothetical protein
MQVLMNVFAHCSGAAAPPGLAVYSRHASEVTSQITDTATPWARDVVGDHE